MPYIEYNIEENSISVNKDGNKFHDEINLTSSNENFEVYHRKNKFFGIKTLNIFSDIELQGRHTEGLFKKILDNNNVPFLYVGQGPIGIEYSDALKNITKSKRPDFLINIPDIGILFIDVKCRQKISFHSGQENYFSLFISEVQALINLHEQILIPVWLAFYDKLLLNTNELKFNLVPISMIKKYIDGIYSLLDKKEISSLSVLRIPNDLLYEIEETLVFKAALKSIDEEFFKIFAKYHIDLIKRVENEIKTIVKNETVLKTNISSKVLDNIGKNIIYKKEIEIILEQMIDDGKIIFSPKKKLTLPD